MRLTKAETLEKLKEKVSIFEIPSFFYFTVSEYKENKDIIYKKITKKFDCNIVIRSSSIFEDGKDSSAAGEFESVLNINPSNKKDVNNAIKKVIESYSHKYSDKNQILIQEMLTDTSMSGVAFTHDLNTGAPYYVINYDDESGSTDTVTSGKGEYSNRTLYIHRESTLKLNSDRFKKLISAIQELESIQASKYLDIEFALSNELKPYLFQVRSITTHSSVNLSLNKNINSSLKVIETSLKNHLKRIEGIYGETSVFGQMPDWNPVEMIGRAPRALASSLYKLIITDNAWRIARKKMGYATPSGQKLMKIFAGQPFIDTRLSFHSYLPMGIEHRIANKLVDHWVKKLSSSPELHDKIEFDVAITAYSFDFEEKVENLIGDALNKEDKETFKKLHISQTKKLIKGGSDGSLDSALNMVNVLKEKKYSNQSNHTNLHHQFIEMIDDCINLGTIPFSILARHGFIAKTILLSLVNKRILTYKEMDQIQGGVYTIASELVDDMNALNIGVLDIQDFMKKYGHLRPGTYDILSQRYDQMDGFSSDSSKIHSSESKKIKEPFKFKKNQKYKINNLLNMDGFGSFDADDLLKYIQKAIEGREYGKFIFTKTLSDLIEKIAYYGESINLTRSDLSNIPIENILKSFKLESTKEKYNYLRGISEDEENKHKVSVAIRLPQLLIDTSSVYIVPFQVSQPNFITNQKITSSIQLLDSNNESINMNNKIVLIEGADPGYDWIFSQNIAGLITKYGGANSHMAIRCAEFGIPAAIGCGEQRYNAIKNSKQVHLDCSAGLLMPIN